MAKIYLNGKYENVKDPSNYACGLIIPAKIYNGVFTTENHDFINQLRSQVLFTENKCIVDEEDHTEVNVLEALPKDVVKGIAEVLGVANDSTTTKKDYLDALKVLKKS